MSEDFVLPLISEYHYDLPAERIAAYPTEKRGASLLLNALQEPFLKMPFSKLPTIIPQNTLMVFNETRVIPARLHFYKGTGAKIEIFLLKPLSGGDFQIEMTRTESTEWEVLIGNASKWKDGVLELSLDNLILYAERTGQNSVRFSWSNPGLSFAAVLAEAGKVPLPPYIKRESEKADLERYQTVFAKREGSVAAPTAGLHFSDTIMEELKESGQRFAKVSLDVGIGTFRPVKGEVKDHDMHKETIHITHEELENLVENIDRSWLFVGTTTLRTMESLYLHALKIHHGLANEANTLNIQQWDHLQVKAKGLISKKEAFEKLLQISETNEKSGLSGDTSLFILKGQPVITADLLLTNFHQPLSTLLMLVDAFASVDWKKAYDFALENDFRFLSYGDACLFRLAN